MLNQELLENCGEFLELIANEEQSDELTDAVESLREYLEQDVDGWTSHSDLILCEAVQSQLEEIWNLISDDEKATNNQLEDYFNEVMETVSEGLEEVDSEDRDYEEDYDFEDEESDDSEEEEEEW